MSLANRFDGPEFLKLDGAYVDVDVYDVYVQSIEPVIYQIPTG